MTKKALYIFNPEHDLALASGETNYMAPASARQMASELALLPMWYAEEGSVVLAPSAYNLDYVKKIQELLGLSVDLMTEPELASERNLDIRPWGWDIAIRKRLLDLGVEESELPSIEQLDKLRFCSHRSCAVGLLPQLQLGACFCGESFYLTFPEEWKSFVESHDTCLLKAPLSGSGKGLNWCKGVYTPSISGWCSRIGNQQGGVIGEPLYNKVRDFAMEFEMKDGKALYRGLSLFDTIKNAYSGNVLCSEADKVEMMKPLISEAQLAGIRQRIIEVMEPALKDIYSGPFGVDMMICTKGEKDEFCEAVLNQEGEDVNRTGLGVVPCIEINLRKTMGHVAIDLYEHLVANSSDEMKTNRTNIMRVEYDGNRYHLRIKPGRPSEEAPLH